MVIIDDYHAAKTHICNLILCKIAMLRLINDQWNTDRPSLDMRMDGESEEVLKRQLRSSLRTKLILS